MNYYYDEDEFEAVIEHRPCSCGGKCNGYCNGMASYSMRRRTSEAIKAIKEKRRIEHENAILLEADMIRARRGIQ
jgi:hypothetical protein